MADKNLSGRPTAARPFAATDYLYLVQGGNTRKFPITDIDSVGKHPILVPSGAWTPDDTNGPEAVDVSLPTNSGTIKGLAFDGTASEYCYFAFDLPKSWDKGTLTYVVTSTTEDTGATGVAWSLDAVAISDGESFDQAFGTSVIVTDTLQSGAKRKLTSAESGAVTIAGTPADGDTILVRFGRQPANAGDTTTADMVMVNVTIFYTTDAPTDA